MDGLSIGYSIAGILFSLLIGLDRIMAGQASAWEIILYIIIVSTIIVVAVLLIRRHFR